MDLAHHTDLQSIAYIESMLDQLIGQAAKPIGEDACIPPELQGIAMRIDTLKQKVTHCVQAVQPYEACKAAQGDKSASLLQLQQALSTLMPVPHGCEDGLCKSTQGSGYHILSQIINQSTDAISVFGPTGELLFCNTVAQNMTGGLLNDLRLFKRLKQKADSRISRAKEDYYCKQTNRWLRINLSHIQWFGEQNAYLMVINDTTEYRQREEKILYQARMDGLTGVYNRTGGLAVLREWLQQEEQYPICVCFIDIDFLKQINDRYGHHEGDVLISAVADAIRSCCRREDICMRIGGDEFLIVLPSMNYAAAKCVVANIMDTLCSSLSGMNKPYSASFSCGIEEVTAMQQVLLDELIQRADQRMYEAKRQNHAKCKQLFPTTRVTLPRQGEVPISKAE